MILSYTYHKLLKYQCSVKKLKLFCHDAFTIYSSKVTTSLRIYYFWPYSNIRCNQAVAPCTCHQCYSSKILVDINVTFPASLYLIVVSVEKAQKPHFVFRGLEFIRQAIALPICRDSTMFLFPFSSI